MLEIIMKKTENGSQPPSVFWDMNAFRDPFDDHWVVRNKPTAPFWLDEIKAIVADGIELAWVKEQIVNLSYPRHAKQVRWDGDMARFIAQAIPDCRG